MEDILNSARLTGPADTISLERTSCHGTCPVYQVTIRRDGNITYVGREHVNHIGTHTGFADPEAVERLFKLADKYKFFGFKDKYPSATSGGASAITSIQTGTRRKRVENQAEAGPDELWALEHLIDVVTEQVFPPC